MPFAMPWMDLETVIQSEVNQKEKDKYHIISLTYGIQKNGTDELILCHFPSPATFKLA